MGLLIALFIATLGAVSQNPLPGETDEMLRQLSKVRIDKKQIYNVRDIRIRRDVLSIALNRGLIAFLEPVAGRVTGAVFIGSAEIVAIPPDSIEKQQIYKFTGTPILNETFQTALFRFTDDTYEEIEREISQHASEDVSADDAAQFDSWDETFAARAKVLNFRLLADLLELAGRPLFLGELKGDKAGWFNVVFDPRAVEEISIFQVREIAGAPAVDLWASFNQRSESRDREAVAHENKSPIDILAYDIDLTVDAEKQIDAKVSMRVKGRIDGTRVVNFDLPPSLHLASISMDAGEPVPFYQFPDTRVVFAVLPRPLKSGQEIALRFAYAGKADERELWYPNQGSPNIAIFNLNVHPPAGATAVSTGNGAFPRVGFEIGNVAAVSDENGPGPVRSYLSGMLGAYPYGSLTVFQSAEKESQNWPMLIEPPPNENPTMAEHTMAQEIARQWFGHRVMPASYHDQWLFDGLAGYLGAMYIEAKYPGSQRFWEVLEDARSRLKSLEGSGSIWLGQRLASTVTPTGYRAVYNKALWVIHMLRAMLRQDGQNPDTKFSAMLREFVDAYGGKPASTWDFKRLAEKYADKKLDWFFDEWVFGTGVPSYSADYKIEALGTGFSVDGVIKQSGVPEGFVMQVPVYADDVYLGSVAVGDSEGDFRFRLAKRPERIVIDPERTILTTTSQ